MLLDLGGIAKGFAVDQAIHALRRGGCTEAIVNAGGDLRRFGREPHPIYLRRSTGPVQVAELRCGAVATSSPYKSVPDRLAADRLHHRSEAAAPVERPRQRHGRCAQLHDRRRAYQSRSAGRAVVPAVTRSFRRSGDVGFREMIPDVSLATQAIGLRANTSADL